jgi:hypothetical protein
VNRLISLPERVFAAFSSDQHRSLESWPTLLMGSNTGNDAFPTSSANTSAVDVNYSSDHEFSLRVAFAAAEERASLRDGLSGPVSSVD